MEKEQCFEEEEEEGIENNEEEDEEEGIENNEEEDEEEDNEPLKKIHDLLQSNRIEKASFFIDKYDNENPNQDELCQYDTLILHSFIFLKKGDFTNAHDSALKASQIKPSEILPFKLQLISSLSTKNKEKKIIAMIETMFERCSKSIDKEALMLAANHINIILKNQKDSLFDQFFIFIKNDLSLLDIIEYFPFSQENKEKTRDKRKEFLQEIINDDTNNQEEIETAIKMLCRILIVEEKKFKEVEKYKSKLGKNNSFTILLNILTEIDPVKRSKASKQFPQFTQYSETLNILALQRFVQNEQYFPSGWIELSQHVKGNDKINAIQNALSIDLQNNAAQTALKKVSEELMIENNGKSNPNLMDGKVLLKNNIDQDEGSVDLRAIKSDCMDNIKKGDFKKALSMLKNINENWAYFWSAFLCLKLEKYEHASKEFQKYLSIEKQNAKALIGLTWSYFARSMYQSIDKILSELNEFDSSLKDLEMYSNLINQYRISDSVDFQNSPVQFFCKLSQIIENMTPIYRRDSASFFVKKYSSLVSEYFNKWGEIPAVAKISGDFYTEVYIGTNDKQYKEKALNCYKKKVELDKRAESFLDLGYFLQRIGDNETAKVILLRALAFFQDNSFLWLNLGVIYILLSQYSPARHCLIVASNILAQDYLSIVYYYIAYIAHKLNDIELLKSSLSKAKQINPQEELGWKLELITEGYNLKIDENDPIPNNNIKHICDLKYNVKSFLEKNRNLQALEYSFKSNYQLGIARSYESLGRYSDALSIIQSINEPNANYTSDDKYLDIKRLTNLISNNISEYQIFQQIKNCDEEKINEIINNGSIIAKLSLATYLISVPNISAAQKIIDSISISNPDYCNSPFYKKYVEFLKVHLPEKVRISSEISKKDPYIYLLKQRKKHDECLSFKKMIEKFPEDEKSIKLYISYYMKQSSITTQLNKLLEYVQKLQATRETQKMKIAICIKAKNFQEAKKSLQVLYIMDPNSMSKTKTLFKELNSFGIH